jgi:glycerophosphoryl diester phosphodiesterase
MRLFGLCLIIGCGGTSPDGPAETGDTDGTQSNLDDHWALSDAFLNIAHRGGALLGPENTLEAIGLSVDAGVKVVEIDLFMTSDGHLVILHDETVDATTEGTGRIQDMTLADAQALDAGYPFTLDEGATYPFRGKGVKIPTWEDAMAAFPGLYWDVEIKQTEPPINDEVVASILAAGIKDHVFIACFDDATVQDFRAEYPNWVTNMGDNEYLYWGSVDENDDSYEPPGQIPQMWDFYYNDTLPGKADATGVKLHVWTVNTREKMSERLADGVDGIITDDPITLLEVMAEQGIPGL